MTQTEFALSMPIGAWHPLLPAALRSIAIQKARVNLAILDASGDPRVSEAITSSGVSVVYRRDGADQGQAAAIAEGWANVPGAILGWLNADDILMPDALEIAARALARPDAPDVVFGDSVIIDAEGAVLGLHGQVGAVDQRIVMANMISQPSCFVRRSAVEAVGGINPRLAYTMDWELWIRLFRAGMGFHHVDHILSAVFWGEATKTSELGARRLSEIGRVSLRYGGPIAAARTLVGVLTQAHGDRKWVRDRVARRRGPPPSAVGIYTAADGNPGEIPTPVRELRLLNTGDVARSTIRIVTRGGEARVEIDGLASTDAPEEGVRVVQLSRPVEPGEVIAITLIAQGQSVRLRRVEWHG